MLLELFEARAVQRIGTPSRMLLKAVSEVHHFCMPRFLLLFFFLKDPGLIPGQTNDTLVASFPCQPF